MKRERKSFDPRAVHAWIIILEIWLKYPGSKIFGQGLLYIRSDLKFAT